MSSPMKPIERMLAFICFSAFVYMFMRGTAQDFSTDDHIRIIGIVFLFGLFIWRPQIFGEAIELGKRILGKR